MVICVFAASWLRLRELLPGRRVATPREGPMKGFIHTYRQRQPQQAEVKVNMRSYALSFDPRSGGLELGSILPVKEYLESLESAAVR